MKFNEILICLTVDQTQYVQNFHQISFSGSLIIIGKTTYGMEPEVWSYTTSTKDANNILSKGGSFFMTLFVPHSLAHSKSQIEVP